MLRLLPFAIAAAATMVSPTLGGQANPLDPKEIAEGDLVRFQVDPADRMTVPVVMSNGETHRFLIDTGAERTAVARDVASNLSLPNRGSKKVTSFAGTAMVPVVQLGSLELEGSSLAKVDALTFDRFAIGADGLLGIDSLGGYTIDFDFKGRKLTMSRPRYEGRLSRGEVKVRADMANDRLMLSNATAERMPVSVILDTGTSISIGNEALKKALLAKGKLGPTKRLKVMSVTGQVAEIDYGFIRRVVIDRSVYVERMPIAFAVTEPFASLGMSDQPALLLGMDVLHSFGGVTIDFKRKEVRFRPANDLQRPPPNFFGWLDS